MRQGVLAAFKRRTATRPKAQGSILNRKTTPVEIDKAMPIRVWQACGLKSEATDQHDFTPVAEAAACQTRRPGDARRHV